MTGTGAAVLAALILQVAVVTAAVIPNPAELATQNGYLGETHSVETRDGYLLDAFRIRSVGGSGGWRGPVLVMPGLACNAAIWVLLGPGKALAYLLADEGYDVWLGSYRGNMFARRHVNLSDSDPAFWDFSCDEVGRLDLPALLERALAVSGRTQLAYIGHSMGSSSLLVLADEEPHYMANISHAYFMAPAAFLGHTSAPIIANSMSVLPLFQLGGFGPFGGGEITLKSWWARLTLKGVCANVFLRSICSVVEGMYVGEGTELRNTAGWATYTDYVPDSIAIRLVEHLVQHIGKEHVFRRYDFGEANLEKYGAPGPPSYNLSRATMPVSIYYGDNDKLVTPQDSVDLAAVLPNVVRPAYEIPYKGFNHADFFLGVDAKQFLYDKILENMKEDEGATSKH